MIVTSAQLYHQYMCAGIRRDSGKVKSRLFMLALYKIVDIYICYKDRKERRDEMGWKRMKLHGNGVVLLR